MVPGDFIYFYSLFYSLLKCHFHILQNIIIKKKKKLKLFIGCPLVRVDDEGQVVGFIGILSYNMKSCVFLYYYSRKEMCSILFFFKYFLGNGMAAFTDLCEQRNFIEETVAVDMNECDN